MKAYVIKTKIGYIKYTDSYFSRTNDLREAFLYLTIENAREELCNWESAKIIPIEIKEIK